MLEIEHRYEDPNWIRRIKVLENQDIAQLLVQNIVRVYGEIKDLKMMRGVIMSDSEAKITGGAASIVAVKALSIYSVSIGEKTNSDIRRFALSELDRFLSLSESDQKLYRQRLPQK
jgi:hypothetical protein